MSGVVMIVDDEAPVLASLSEILSKMGYEVRPFTSSSAAAEHIKIQNDIDIIISDVNMSEISGYELCTLVKGSEVTKNIPILLVSAIAEHSDIQKGLECGAVDYIIKPFFADEIRLKVKNHLTIAHFTKELERRVRDEVEKNRQNEQMLLQQSKMAGLGEIIGAIAHQWKQPLNFLSMHAHTLLDLYEDGELTREALDDFINKQVDTVKFMSQTISDFKNFYKPSRHKTNFELMRATEEVLKLYGKELGNRNIVLEICCLVECGNDCRYSCFIPGDKDGKLFACKDDRYEIYGYKNEFKQVLLNIINNAKDAIVDRKIEKGIISIYLFRNDDVVTLEIEDNAGGMSQEVLDKVFEPYFSTKGEDGTGIGLYMSKTIIETNMGGKLSVWNGEKGARFKLEFFETAK